MIMNKTQELTLPTMIDGEEILHLRLLYNMFDVSQVEKHELAFVKGSTLAETLGEMPSDIEWGYSLNGEVVSAEEAPLTYLAAGDVITVVQIPQGGKNVKMVLQIVAMVALAYFTFGAGAIFATTFANSIAFGVGAMIIAFAFAPKPPKQKNKDEDTYGIDGEKNTVNENIPVPVVYGEYRVGGNLVDVSSENVNDSQYLYLRSVLSDGEIEGVYDIEFNEQPITNFKDVQIRKSLGTASEPVNDWFSQTVRQVNKNIKFSDTDWRTHVTAAPVDRLRYDILFPAGLVNIGSKSGDYKYTTVTFEFQYRKAGTTTWLPYGSSSWERVALANTTSTTASVQSLISARVNVAVDAAMLKAVTEANSEMTVTLQYRQTGSPTWLTYSLQTVTAADVKAATPQAISYWGVTLDGAGYFQTTTKSFIITGLNGGDYEFQVINGTISEIDRLKAATDNTMSVTNANTKALRRSFEGGVLPDGTALYEFRVRRITPLATAKEDVDECYWSDASEITIDNVAMRRVANMSFKVKMTDQLNSIPTTTARVKGALCQQYDQEGNPTVKEWTDNCAWITLDMLCGDERGVGFPTARIDWNKFYEWAQDCNTYGWKFNGLFKEHSNVADAMKVVMQVGHAMPVRLGTKFSLAIDKPRTPSMVFGSGSIINDTFSITYNGVQDRANEFEVTYNDRNDRNKARTIRLVDPNAVARNEIPKVASYRLDGVDNAEQAQETTWRNIYSNRLLLRNVKFDAPIEAIGMSIGDVALIAHDMVQWANTGRLESGSTTTVLQLDRDIEMSSGSSYGAIVHYSALQQATCTVSSVIGRTLVVNAAVSLAGMSIERIRSATADEFDFEILNISHISGFNYSIRLSEIPTDVTPGMVMALWSVDAIYERNVVFAEGTHNQVTLAAALPAAPSQYATWFFGPLVSIKHPYQLRGIAGEGTVKRSLTFLEYSELVYAEPEHWVPIPVADVSPRVIEHVRGLAIDYDALVPGDKTIINVHVSWSGDNIKNYGGADVYVSLNGQDFRSLVSVPNMSETFTQVSRGDTIEFKVVAYNKQGDRANANTAPTVGTTIDVDVLSLDEPETLTSNIIILPSSATAVVTWTTPVTDLATPTSWDVQYRLQGALYWEEYQSVLTERVEITGLKVGVYDVRVRARLGTASSTWASVTVTVQMPGMRPIVTGLKLNNGTPDLLTDVFSGTDPVFTWTPVTQTDSNQFSFLDYEVKIFTTAGALLRTEYVSDPSYIYTFQKNMTDSYGASVVARRSFKIEVRDRAINGSVSAAPGTMQASNPTPGAPNLRATDKSFNFISVQLEAPADPDVIGVKVWASGTTPVAKTDANLKHSGAIGTVQFAAASNTIYYIRYAAYDAFGDGAIGTEAEVSITTDPNPASAADVTPPAMPAGLSFTGSLVTQTDGTLQPRFVATWTENTEVDLASYELAVQEGAGNWITFTVGKGQAAGTNPRYEFVGKLGTAYTAKVRALDYFANRSTFTDAVVATAVIDTTAPALPTSIGATASVRNIFLTWTNPADADVAAVEIWENTSNDSATATRIATVNAAPNRPGAFTRSAVVTGTAYYYWLKAVDTSGNTSAFTASVSATPITLVNADIAAGTITADRVKAYTLTGDRFDTATSLPGTITVGTTGVSIGTVESRASNPAARVNAGATTIDPGKILVSGTTTLSDWRHGSDLTKIDGGDIFANSLTANKVTVGLRGLDIAGLEFEAQKTGANILSWSAGTISYINDAGTPTTVAITTSTVAWTTATLYLYWVQGATTISSTTTLATAYGANNIVLATYRGGVDLAVTYGRTIISGTQITTGTIEADRLKADTVLANRMYVGGTGLSIHGSYFGTGKGAIVVNDGTLDRVMLGWTSGTTLGIKIVDAAGATVLDSSTTAAQILNSSVTLGSLGYTGDTNATNGATIGTSLSGTFNSTQVAAYFAAGAIGNTYISSLDAGKITAGNIVVAVNVGTTGKIILDGVNNRILISD